MAQTTNNKPLVRVIETQAVDYEKHSFLFFYWYVKVKAETLRNDLFIETNDEFNSVFIGGKEYIKKPPVQ